MGLMDKFENAIEKGVRSTFSRNNKGEVTPVEIASRLRRDMDEKAISLSEGRILCPNLFEVDLGSEDYSRAKNWGGALADELCEVGMEHATAQGYHLPGKITVTFGEDTTLSGGEFRVEAYIVNDEENHTPARPSEQLNTQNPQQTTVISQPTASAVTVTTPQKRHAAIDLDGQRYTLNASSIIIGRSTAADIMVDDPGVSRRHLEIQVKDHKAYAIDLGSTNGSLINTRKLQGSLELQDSSTITVGHTKAVFRWVNAS